MSLSKCSLKWRNGQKNKNCLKTVRLGGLTAAGRVEKEFAESDIAEGWMGLGLEWGVSLPSYLFYPLSSHFLFAPSSTREPVQRRYDSQQPQLSHMFAMFSVYSPERKH